MHRTVYGSLLLAALCAHAATASAADPNLGRNLAATCANCHGTNGHSVGGTEPLAGVAKDKIVTTMNAFKSGEKPASIMHQLAKGLNDAQIDAIAGYYAAQK